MAAELVLSTVLQQLPVLFEKLSSAALKSIARHKGIDAEIKKWQRSLTHIQLYLTHASQMEITDPSLKQRLIDLQHLAYDIDDLLDGWLTDPEFKQEPERITGNDLLDGWLMTFMTCCTTFSRTTTMVAELDDISTKLQDLVKEKADLGLKVEEETRPRIINNNRRLQTSVFDPSSIVGRQAEKEALVQQLLLLDGEPCDKNYSIVPIIGMGGVGKTTLAGLLYNDVQVKDHFELKAWICISDEFDVSVRSKEIFIAFGGEVKEEHKNFNKLQEALRDHLTGKRFLLVLDDVWSERPEDWKNLVRPFYTCSPGSKILITTRKNILLKKLGYISLYTQLESLSDDDALSLFALHALGIENFDSHLSLKPHGEDIVKKCNKLPLALIALGTSLRTKKDEDSWKRVLESEIWRSPVEDEVIPALRLSYLDLSAPLKRLFAYCSLFPKDFLFDKEDLVLLWMAEGFLQQATPNDSTEEQCLGRKFFDELLSRSFFQHALINESLFVMHDLMNDLATSVATEFYLRLDNESEKNIKKMKLEKYRHMSFVREEYVAYKKLQVLENTKCLRTFLATSVGEVKSRSFFFLSSKILTDFLPELPLLRVLSLSGFRISEVPESIGTLRHLRYLNLSQSSIDHLPETVGNLCNLQTLILFGCYNLTKLPNNFIKLKNLRNLDVRYTRLLFQMVLKIGELRSLEITLSKIDIKSESGTEIAKLKDFKNLHGKISIKGLEKVQNANDAQEANFSQKKLSELDLVWGYEIDDSRNEIVEKAVLNELKPCQDELIKLGIRSYGGLEFPNWVGDRSFLHLKHVSISGCKRCRSVPPLGQLPSLKELLIEGLHGVEVVGFELFGTSEAFRSLEILSFEDMPGWKKWSSAVFPRLQKLQIKDCPNLVEVTLEAMPSLNVTLEPLHSSNELRISNCPNLVEVTLKALPSLNVLKLNNCNSGVLRRLVEVASAVTKLDIYSISGLNDVVWGGVIKYLGAVEELKIWRCNEIKYLVKSDADESKILVKSTKLQVDSCDNLVKSDAVVSKVLVKLKELEVSFCDKFVSLGEKEEDNGRSNILTSLRKLEVSNCKNMERCSSPDGIEKLTVKSCSSMTVVSFPKGGQEKLRSLRIENCSNLLGGQMEMPMLEFFMISGWPNLKSIIELNCLAHLTELIIQSCENLESFPNNLTSLKKLKIHHCPKLESFPETLTSLKKLEIKYCSRLDVSFLLDKLTSLEGLTIENCPRMDASLPGWVWPHNLCFLSIKELKKPFSEWGQQNFPTSLVRLYLYGGGEDGVSSCSQLSHLLPPSLTSLEINGFKKLESVSTGLQHLTSLHHLYFRDCPNMKKVSSHPQHLQHLTFSFCHNLEKVSLHPQHLRYLDFSFCPNLKKVSSHPQHLTSLQHLSFYNCHKMKDLPEMLLPSLVRLFIGGDCPELKERCSSKNGSYWPLISHIPCIDIR